MLLTFAAAKAFVTSSLVFRYAGSVTGTFREQMPKHMHEQHLLQHSRWMDATSLQVHVVSLNRSCKTDEGFVKGASNSQDDTTHT
jgi:hypothetical protein